MGARGPMPMPEGESTSRHLNRRYGPLGESSVAATNPPPSRWSQWTTSGRDWWTAALADPMSRMWSTLDWEIARRICDLLSDIDRARKAKKTPPATLLTEIRNLEGQLLVTIAARRRARLKTEDVPSAHDETPPSADKPDYRQMIAEV